MGVEVPTLSVVIPCFRSSESIGDLTSRLISTLDRESIDFELLLVNDASPDDGLTWKKIIQACRSDPRIYGFNMQYNVGQFLSTIAGMKESKGDYVAIMDDDLQHQPEEIPTLFSKITETGADAIIADLSQKKHSRFRNLGTSFVDLTFALFHGKPKGLKMSSFAIFKRPVVNSIVEHKTKRPVLNSLVLSSTKNIVNVQVSHFPRESGSSGYGFRDLVRASMDIIFYATTAPLRFFSVLGALISLSSFGYSGYLIYSYLTEGSTVPGFTTIAVLIGTLGGLNLLGMGLIGEYIERIIAETSGRPRWIISEKINDVE